MKQYEIIAGTPRDQLEIAQRELTIDLELEDLTPRQRKLGERTLTIIDFELSQQDVEQ